jgi:hypothetical protein
MTGIQFSRFQILRQQPGKLFRRVIALDGERAARTAVALSDTQW